VLRAVVVSLLFVSSFAALTNACDRGGGEAGSCTIPALNACLEYPPATAKAGKRMCHDAWRPGSGTCPRDNLLGTCARDGAVVEHTYAGPPNAFTVAGAQATCERAGGTWRLP
jgi:hypothetical protein